MRLSRLLTLVLSVALLGLPGLVLGAGTAAAAEVGDTRLIIYRAPKVQLYRGPVEVRGRLDVWTESGWANPGAGQTVDLERRWAGADSFSVVDSAETGNDGFVEFDVAAKRNATLHLRFEGGSMGGLTLTQSRSANVVSKVMRDLGARQPASGSRIVWKGNVDPGWGNKPVLLQRKTCKSCGWKQVDKTRTASNGAWKFVVGAPAKGSWWFRTVVRGTTEYVRSYSARLRTYRL